MDFKFINRFFQSLRRLGSFLMPSMRAIKVRLELLSTISMDGGIR